MSTSAYLTVGARVQWDGEAWTVTELSAESVRLQGRAASRVLAITTLLSGSDFRFLGEDCPPVEATGPALFGMSPAQVADVREREGHIREVLTGYKSGTPALPQPGEPRSEYAPETRLGSRYEAKAKEMGLSESQVRRLASGYKESGVAALVDGRKHAKTLPLGRVDPLW